LSFGIPAFQGASGARYCSAIHSPVGIAQFCKRRPPPAFFRLI
jgi:hypothetical protein